MTLLPDTLSNPAASQPALPEADTLLPAPSMALLPDTTEALPRLLPQPGTTVVREVDAPRDYALRTDDVPVVSLLLSFFLLTCVFVRVRSFIFGSVKALLSRKRTDAAPPPVAGVWDFILAFSGTSVIAAFYLYAAVAQQWVSLPLTVPVWLTGAVGIGVIFVLLTLKLSFMQAVNAVFFTREACVQWRSVYLLLVAVCGLLLLPLAALVVYTPLRPTDVLYALAGIFVLCKLLLVFGECRIISGTNTAFSHAFLYICTLELLPLFFLWKCGAYLCNNTQLTDIL